MNKLRIERKNIYSIEVNENGDVIEFDLEDIELPLKAERAIQKLNALKQNVRLKVLNIQKREDKNGVILSQNEQDIIKVYSEGYKEMRKAFDEFLGKGACYKIFGNRNYFSMFDDLIEQLEPHMERIGLNYQSVIKSIEKKYSNKDEDTI